MYSFYEAEVPSSNIFVMVPLWLDTVSFSFTDLDINASLPNPDPDLTIPHNVLDCHREINMSVITK